MAEVKTKYTLQKVKCILFLLTMHIRKVVTLRVQ